MAFNAYYGKVAQASLFNDIERTNMYSNILENSTKSLQMNRVNICYACDC